MACSQRPTGAAHGEKKENAKRRGRWEVGGGGRSEEERRDTRRSQTDWLGLGLGDLTSLLYFGREL